jgi:hypothetical protein
MPNYSVKWTAATCHGNLTPLWQRPLTSSVSYHVSPCLISALLYFLFPAEVACSPYTSSWAWSAWSSAYQDEAAYLQWRNSLDFSFLEMPYSKCKVASRPYKQSAREQCYVSKLSTRCSDADDCLVQCIANGINGKVGGGCWHVCFETKFDLSKWSAPKGMRYCDQLKGNGS